MNIANHFRFLFLLCAALPLSLAAQDRLVSVDGWPKMGTRQDAKLQAFEFKFLTQVPQASPTGKGTVQDFQFMMYVGDAVTLFTRHALDGRFLKTVLIETDPANRVSPAPVTVRLSDVRVTSVNLSLGSQLQATVTLQASKIEVFTANPATGAMQPFRWDIKAGKGM